MKSKSNGVTKVIYKVIYINHISFLQLDYCRLPADIQRQPFLFNKNHSRKSTKNYCYLEYGKIFQALNPDSASLYYQKAKSLAIKFNDQKSLSKYISYQISLLNQTGKFEEGLALAQQDLAIAQKLNDPKILIAGYNDVANEYEYMADYQQASEYYIKSLKLATDKGDEEMQSKINDNLASVFLWLKDYPLAYKYSTKAFVIAQKRHDTVTMGNCLLNTGVAEIHKKKYQDALLHFSQSEKIGYQIPDMSLVADALSDEGLVYYTIHDLKTAGVKYQQELDVTKKYHLPYEELYALFELAVVEKDKKNLHLAENYTSRAIAIGEDLNTPAELMEMYDTMSVIKQKLGKPMEALLFKNKYVAINDSMMNAQIQTNIHHLNIQYHSAQKDKMIAEQNLNIERNKASLEKKNMWLFIFFGGIVALIVILILSIRSYRHKHNLHRQSMLTLQKQHEVNTLKEKMQAREEERDRIGREMHDDIGSALTTILYLSNDLKSKSSQADSTIPNKIAIAATGVVNTMNEIIWSMNRQYDTLEDLIAYTRHHAVQFLQNHSLKYHFDLPEFIPNVPISGEQRRNIYLVIKESLHNIVKHSEATEVTISFQFQGGIRSCIHDNGKGFKTPALHHFGNGLKNMQARIQSIGGTFEIENANGTTIHIFYPFANKEEPSTAI